MENDTFLYLILFLTTVVSTLGFAYSTKIGLTNRQAVVTLTAMGSSWLAGVAIGSTLSAYFG